jgi:hypothetical protein
MYRIPEYLAWFNGLSIPIIGAENSEELVRNITSNIGAKSIWELFAEEIFDGWFYKTVVC